MSFETAFRFAVGARLWRERGGNIVKSGAALKSEFYNIAATSPFFSPFSNGSINTVDGVCARCSKIIGLLNRCSPSAVSRLISSIVIDSIDGHAFRAFSHGLKKCREIISPFIAYSYPAPSPQAVPGIFFVVAPVFHVRPNTIRPRISQSMRAHRVASNFSLQASTRHCVPVPELCRSNKGFSSAVAHANPATLFVPVLAYCWIAFALNKQSAVSFPG